MEENVTRKPTKSDIMNGENIEYKPIEKKSVNEINLGEEYDQTRKLLNI